MQIVLPEQSPKKELAIAITRVLTLGGSSVINPLLGLSLAYFDAQFSVTHPSQTKQALKQWHMDVTNTINSLQEAILPTIKLSDSAIMVAIHLCNTSQYGRPCNDYIYYNDLYDTLSQYTPQDIKKACGELAAANMVKIKQSSTNKTVTPLVNLFWVFDKMTFEDRNPLVDALTIAQKLQENAGQSLCCKRMLNELNWTFRRFNPALSIILEIIIPDGASIPSNEYRKEFITTSIRVNEVGLALLNKFIANHSEA